VVKTHGDSFLGCASYEVAATAGEGISDTNISWALVIVEISAASTHYVRMEFIYFASAV